MRGWQDFILRGRPLGSYTRVQLAYSSRIRDSQRQYGRVPAEKRYLNVGCGPNIYAAFVNADWQWRPGIDVCLDIVNGIRFPDARFDGVFTEHCLEHVSFDQCVGVLREFHRLLVPGGTLRIIVPDGELYLDLYARWKTGDRTRFPYVDSQGELDLVEDSRYGFTPIMAVNRIFRGYGHLFAYDYKTFAGVLRHVGLAEIRKRAFREGRDPIMLIDSEVRRPPSLVTECRRPASDGRGTWHLVRTRRSHASLQTPAGRQHRASSGGRDTAV